MIVIMQESQLRGQSQRDSSSPTLIMEVVSVGEDEEREDAEEKTTGAKMNAASPSYCGKHKWRKTKKLLNNHHIWSWGYFVLHLLAEKRPRRTKKVPVVYVENSDTELDVPANAGEWHEVKR